MKKIFMCFLWVIVFNILFGFGTAMFLGGMAGAKAKVQQQNPGKSGFNAGHDFGKKYGKFVFFGSVVLAIIGTATSKLPGTKD